MVQVIASSGSAKTPLDEQFVGPMVAGNDKGPALITEHPDLFAPGGKKGLFLSEATNAEFAERMREVSPAGARIRQQERLHLGGIPDDEATRGGKLVPDRIQKPE